MITTEYNKMISILYYILTLTALPITTTTTAHSTVIQAFNGAHPYPQSTLLPLSALQASIVSANALATTIALQCRPGTHCAINPTSPITITEGPSTFTMSAVYPTKTGGMDGLVTLVQGCNITSSTRGAGCSVSMRVDLDGSGTGSGSRSASASISATSTSLQTRLREDEIYYRPLTVTAGVEKLNAPEATQMPDIAGIGGGSAGGGIGGVAAAAAVAAAAMLI